MIVDPGRVEDFPAHDRGQRIRLVQLRGGERRLLDDGQPVAAGLLRDDHDVPLGVGDAVPFQHRPPEARDAEEQSGVIPGHHLADPDHAVGGQVIEVLVERLHGEQVVLGHHERPGGRGGERGRGHERDHVVLLLRTGGDRAAVADVDPHLGTRVDVAGPLAETVFRPVDDRRVDLHAGDVRRTEADRGQGVLPPARPDVEHLGPGIEVERKRRDVREDPADLVPVAVEVDRPGHGAPVEEHQDLAVRIEDAVGGLTRPVGRARAAVERGDAAHGIPLDRELLQRFARVGAGHLSLVDDGNDEHFRDVENEHRRHDHQESRATYHVCPAGPDGERHGGQAAENGHHQDQVRSGEEREAGKHQRASDAGADQVGEIERGDAARVVRERQRHGHPPEEERHRDDEIRQPEVKSAESRAVRRGRQPVLDQEADRNGNGIELGSPRHLDRGLLRRKLVHVEIDVDPGDPDAEQRDRHDHEREVVVHGHGKNPGQDDLLEQHRHGDEKDAEQERARKFFGRTEGCGQEYLVLLSATLISVARNSEVPW